MDREIKSFANIICYDENKCINCDKCTSVCNFKALNFIEDKLNFDYNLCYGCKKCIFSCPTNALYFNVNYKVKKCEDSLLIGIVPFDANIHLLQDNYDILTDSVLGEKVQLIERTTEMIAYSNNLLKQYKFEKNNNDFIIFAEDYSINRYLQISKSPLYKQLSKVNPLSYICNIIEKLKSSKKIVYTNIFGVPFSEKLIYFNKKNSINILDIPYKMKRKYSFMDLIYNYCLMSGLDIERNNNELKLTNKYLSLKCLFVANLDELVEKELLLVNYNFIFVSKEYGCTNENLLIDEEINFIYKKYLKEPGKLKGVLKY